MGGYNQNKINKHPNFPQRKSIRLKGYDYSQAGLYFVTICTKNRECLFGNVRNGEMILNDAGKTIEKWYYELENKFPDIQCDEMIIMPNHFHCIIKNVGTDIGAHVGADVGADLCVCPKQITEKHTNKILDEHTNKILDEHTNKILDEHTNKILDKHINDVEGEHIGSPLHRVVQWFKTMSTNEYIRGVKTKKWKPFDGKLWQRNYWEHIIRNENSYHNISNYIINNPKKWDIDNTN